MNKVRWRWARNGGVIGIAIVLADILFEWRGPKFLPWGGEGTASNVVQIITVVAFPALIGLALGYRRDLKRIQGK